MFERAPNISRTRTINHKMEDIRGKRKEKNTNDELILLFQWEKNFINNWTEGDRGNIISICHDIGRRTWK